MLIASLFGKINGGNLIYRLCMLWGDIWFFLIFIFHRNYFEQPPEKDKQYIFVGNHISFLDAPLIVKNDPPADPGIRENGNGKGAGIWIYL